MRIGTTVALAACIFSQLSLVSLRDARAQDRFDGLPGEEIPHIYKSWSLFLVCSPAWILENGDKGLAQLYNQFFAFGSAIGPNNLAIWFRNGPGEPTTANTDFGRNSAYCVKYKLLPSDSPHVLVTTHYPDDPEPGDRFIVSLGGLDAHNSALALTKLADQLLVTGLNQSGLDSSDQWRRVLAAVRSAVNATGCYFNKVSFSLKTSVLNAEIEHSAEGSASTKSC
jgi:hypothetical protein